MTGGLMGRPSAHAFARERCLKETTYRHLVSVEGVMRSLACRFDEDQDLWGLTGLFHDLDQDLIIAATAIATARVVATADARGLAELPDVVVRELPGL